MLQFKVENKKAPSTKLKVLSLQIRKKVIPKSSFAVLTVHTEKPTTGRNCFAYRKQLERGEQDTETPQTSSSESRGSSSILKGNC